MDEKLSEQSGKLVDQTFEMLHELDVYEQNKALIALCSKIIEQRKNQFDRMRSDVEDYGIKTDELLKGLAGIGSV